MVLMVVVGAAVLAMISWAALREAQRMARTSSAAGGVSLAGTGTGAGAGTVERGPARRVAGRREGGRLSAPAHRDRPPEAAPPRVVRGASPSSRAWRVEVGHDPAIPDADKAEAIAAAAALWHVLIDRDRT